MSDGPKMNKKRTVFVLLLIMAFTVMYISLIFNKNIWTDEAYTMELVRENSFWGIVQSTANDVHPPLYYLIVKCFVLLFGDAFPIYKIVSVIPMVLTMALAFTHIRPWWGEQAAILFVVMVNAIPCVLEYAVQMRMYSWALFFVTWAGLGAYGMCTQEDQQAWRHCCIQLAAASLLGCYTHTYAMLSCVCIYLVLFVHALRQGITNKRWILLKGCLLSGSAVAVCYLPWLVVLIRQTMNRIENYWIEPVTWQVVRGYPEFLFASRLPGSTAMYLILCGVAMLMCIGWCRKDKGDGGSGNARDSCDDGSDRHCRIGSGDSLLYRKVSAAVHGAIGIVSGTCVPSKAWTDPDPAWYIWHFYGAEFVSGKL